MLATTDVDLAKLAEQIKAEHAGVIKATRNVVRRAIKAGELLKEAKLKVAHGQWLSWLKANCALPERTAVRYMKLAAGRSKLDQWVRDKSAKLADMKLG